jgi:hypothetical protein
VYKEALLSSVSITCCFKRHNSASLASVEVAGICVRCYKQQASKVKACIMRQAHGV